MKKSSFIEGTFIATFAVVLCKILGLVYVIPFHAIIGSKGGALYSYAYSIYTIFLSLATSGIPIAMSKIISEYETLGYTYTKNRAYKLASRLIILLGVISFLVLFIFADKCAYLILGDVTGGNTIEDVTTVIRVVSTAILIVPLLSVKKGYLQGHKIMEVPYISTVVEQVVRVIIIVLGSYLSYKVLKLSLATSVSVAVFGATIGAIAALIYVASKSRKLKDEDPSAGKKYSDKYILKKIIFYAMPFILIDLIKNAYGMIDVFTVVKGLVKLGYSATDAENVISILSTWGSKLNMIIVSLVVGLSASLVPNMMSSFVKKDYSDVSRKINQSLQILIASTIPMTIGLSFLAQPVWVAFYGFDNVGISIFTFYVFTSISLSFYSLLIDATQTLNFTKLSIGSLLGAFILKALINVPIMGLCKTIGIEAYYGPVIATLISQVFVIIFLLIMLNKKIKVTYYSALKTLIKTILSTGIMVVVLMIIKLFIPLNVTGRFSSILICILYAIVGGIVYLVASYKSGILKDVLGKNYKIRFKR